MLDTEEQIGTHDLRYSDTSIAGFYHVSLRDADDGDVIIVNEDDLVALRDRINKTLEKIK